MSIEVSSTTPINGCRTTRIYCRPDCPAGRRTKPENRVHYPLNPVHEATREDRWTDVPPRTLGGHDGMARAGTKGV